MEKYARNLQIHLQRAPKETNIWKSPKSLGLKDGVRKLEGQIVLILEILNHIIKT